jgi:hypothetical protein
MSCFFDSGFTSRSIKSVNNTPTAMKLCPQCNAKCLNSASGCTCGYSFADAPSRRGSFQERAECVPSIPQNIPPSVMRADSSHSDYLEMTLERVLVIWWSLTWRIVVLGMLIGAFLGFECSKMLSPEPFCRVCRRGQRFQLNITERPRPPLKAPPTRQSDCDPYAKFSSIAVQ